MMSPMFTSGTSTSHCIWVPTGPVWQTTSSESRRAASLKDYLEESTEWKICHKEVALTLVTRYPAKTPSSIASTRPFQPPEVL